jgi:hypothetical protein
MRMRALVKTSLCLAAALAAAVSATPMADAQSRRQDAYRPNGSESSGLGTLDEREQPYETAEDRAPGYEGSPPYRAPYGGPRNPPDDRAATERYPSARDDSYRPPGRSGYASSNPEFGRPYTPPPDDRYGEPRGREYRDYRDPPRDGWREERRDGSYTIDEITRAGGGFFGSISRGLASAIEHTFRRQGRPNGYILGEEGGGAWIAGLRYGQGTMYTKDAGSFPIYWQGPSIGFDVGAAGSKTMILVYNLRDPDEVFDRFGGIDGSAYVVGGVGVTLLARDHITMAPIRSGVGLRLGANVGYLKFSSKPTWNPF